MSGHKEGVRGKHIRVKVCCLDSDFKIMDRKKE